MDAHNSLLDVFSNMQDEFNSSNNRMYRTLDEIFNREIKDLEESLDYFNGEHLVVDKRKLIEIIGRLKDRLIQVKVAHVLNYQRVFDRETEGLKQSMCNFFDLKLLKGENVKKKISCEVKKIFDKMCDFNFIGFEEDLDNEIYDFKVNFELAYISDEYCKDDFNKIVRSFEHGLCENLRVKVASSVIDKQEIFSRHTLKGYDIVDSYKKIKR